MKKRSIGLLLALVLLFSSTGCKESNSIESDSSGTSSNLQQEKGEVKVWSAYNTAKVIKDPAYNENHYQMPIEANVSAARGETESAQLIITTAQSEVQEYTVELEDLYNEEGVKFPKENIDVYFQHYLLCEIKSHNVRENIDNYPVGYTPDALIPQEYSIKHGENHIDANSNQGITIDFAVPSDTIAGTYTGKLKLNIDGVTQEVPVILNVWDYDLSYTNGKNLWDIVEEFIQRGEWNSNTEEVEVLYYETMLKYKLNAYHFPHDESPEGFLQDLKKYAEEPAFSGVFLPDIGGNKEKIFKYYTVIAQYAIEKKVNLFEKIAFYHQTVDEPQGDSVRLEQCRVICNNTTTYLKEFAASIKSYVNGFETLSEDLQTEILNSIINAEQVVTTHYEASEDLKGVVNSFCPTSEWLTTTKQDRYYDYNTQLTGGQKWTYTCLNPYYPLPTYHVDDYGVSGRVLKWIQKDKNITGYLNWSINYYGFNNDVTNAYDDPLRFNHDNINFANGDGYLFYPTVKYNASEPLPSLRLIYARDGQEDYDTLCVLEDRYIALAEEYGLGNISAKLYENLQSYYSQLSNGFYYYQDDQKFDVVRKAVAGLTEAACDDSHTMVFNEVLSSGSIGQVKIYSEAEEVYINGKKQTKKNGCYTYSVNLKLNDTVTISYAINGKTKSFTYYLPSANYAVDLSNMDVSTMKLSDGSVAQKTDNGFAFDIVSKGDTFAEMLAFLPSLSIPLNLNYTEIDRLTIDMRNLSDTPCEFNVFLYAAGSKYKIDEMVLFGYEAYTYSIDKIFENTKWDKLAQAEGISFEFKNANSSGELLDKRKISINSISYTER